MRFLNLFKSSPGLPLNAQNTGKTWVSYRPWIFFSQTFAPQEYPFDQHSGLKGRDLLSVLFYKKQKNQTKTKTPKPPPIGIMEV